MITDKAAAGLTEFLRAIGLADLVDGESIEVRLVCERPGLDGRKPPGDPRCEWYGSSGELVEALPGLRAKGKSGGRAVYFGVAPRHNKNGTASGVRRLSALWLDLDFDKVDGGEAEARGRLSEFPVRPTAVVASGHGLHVYWRLREPAEGDERAAGARTMDAIAAHFGPRVDKVSDLPRILRLPGTFNMKVAEAVVEVVVEELNPELAVTLGDFDIISDSGSLPAATPEPTPASDGSPIVEGRRNTALTSLAGSMRRRGMTEAAILAALREENVARCQPPLEDHEVEGIAASVSKYPPAGDSEGNAEPTEIPAWTPLPVKSLPFPLDRFVTEAAKALGCDPSLVALPLLCAVAGAVGNARVIRLKPGWTEPAILWGATVAESGTLKSPAMSEALRPLRVVQERLLREHAAALKSFEAGQLQHEKALAAWKKSRAESEPPESPERPSARRLLVSDVTVEACGVILLENPRGVLAARDELNGWLSGFNQYKSGRGSDESFWLSAHRAEPHTIDRKTGEHLTLSIPRAAVSICGNIQPGVLARALGEKHFESGLAARLLMVAPPRTPRVWSDATVPDATRELVTVLFDKLLALDLDLRGEEFVPRELDLDEGARAAWIEFYNEHGREQAELTGDLAAAWSKIEGYAARLSLLIHLVRQAADDPELPPDGRIDKASVDAGVALARWFAREAERVYAQLGESDEARDERQLLDLIKRHGGAITVRDLMRGSRRYRCDADEGRMALLKLASKGLGRWEPVAGERGRPSERFVLNGGQVEGDTNG